MEILHVILIWSLLQFGRSCGEDKLDKLTDRVSTLEEDVQKLKSQAVGRNELIRLLALDVAELTGENSGTIDNSNENSGSKDDSNGNSGSEDNSNGNSSNDGNSPDEETTGDERISPVTVLEVRRERLDSKVKLTIKYRPDADGFTIQWHDYTAYGHMADYSDQSLGDGTRETSILTSPVTPLDNTDGMNNTDFNFTVSFTGIIASVYFFSHDGGVLHLMLRDGNEDAAETDINLPVLKVEPPGDLVYDDGENILVKLTTPPDDQHFGPMGPVLGFESYLIDPDSGEIVTSLGHNNIMELLGNKTFPEQQEWSVKLKTSEYKTSGILLFSTATYGKTESSPVEGVWLGTFVTLRPSTQDGPFPAGSLDWVRESWASHRTADNGTFLMGCSAESEVCTFPCAAAGDSITGLEIYKVESDGTRKPVESSSRFVVFKNNIVSIKGVERNFFMNTTTADSERFSCVATNALGKTITQEYLIDYYVPTRIVREGSEVQILNANEVSSILELGIVCRVKGRPHPNVTFTINTEFSYDYGLSPDEVNYVGKDEINAVKYYTYDTSDSYNYNGQYKGKLLSAACTADSGPPYYGYDFYDIPIPTEFEK